MPDEVNDGGRLACGPGLAARAPLVDALSELVARLGETLERHRTTLDRTDGAARAEDAAYADLAARSSAAADALRGLGRALADGQRLGPARHVERALREPAAQEV